MSLHSWTRVYFRNLRTYRAIKYLIQTEMLLLLSTGISVCISFLISFFHNKYCKGEINTKSLYFIAFSHNWKYIKKKTPLFFGQESENKTEQQDTLAIIQFTKKGIHQGFPLNNLATLFHNKRCKYQLCST